MGFYQFTASDHILSCWLTLQLYIQSAFFYKQKKIIKKNPSLALGVTGMKSRCSTWLRSVQVVFLALSPSSAGISEAMPLETPEATKAGSAVVTS